MGWGAMNSMATLANVVLRLQEEAESIVATREMEDMRSNAVVREGPGDVGVQYSKVAAAADDDGRAGPGARGVDDATERSLY